MNLWKNLRAMEYFGKIIFWNNKFRNRKKFNKIKNENWNSKLRIYYFLNLKLNILFFKKN